MEYLPQHNRGDLPLWSIYLGVTGGIFLYAIFIFFLNRGTVHVHQRAFPPGQALHYLWTQHINYLTLKSIHHLSY
jgi:hypothetical protein